VVASIIGEDLSNPLINSAKVLRLVRIRELSVNVSVTWLAIGCFPAIAEIYVVMCGNG